MEKSGSVRQPLNLLLVSFFSAKFSSLIGFVLLFFLPVLIITGIISDNNAYADGDMMVTQITRVSHPAYRVGNIYYGVRNPWNRDFTRLMMYETSTTHPDYGTTGRGLVWGTISELKSWSTLAEYQAAAKPLPNNTRLEVVSEWWSPFTGEENIIYGVDRYSKVVTKINVDTGVVTTVASYDPGDGTNVTNARAQGFSTDNKLIVMFDYPQCDNYGNCKGYEVNVQTGAKIYYSNWNYSRYPQKEHGHSHYSPDRAARAGYGAGTLYGVEYGGQTYTDPIRGTVQQPGGETWWHASHVSWKASNDWYIAGDSGHYDGGSCCTSPHLDTYGIYQIFFDRTTKTFRYVELLKKDGAGLYYLGGSTYNNYHAIPIPTLRLDGNQIFFFSTDGKYGYEDYNQYGRTPWGFEGIFLADLVPVSGTSEDITTPTTPAGLSVVAVSSSRIDLSWASSTDNVGVTGYRIYRNGSQVATVTGTTYSNTGLSGSTAYTYRVSAYDAAGNISAQSAEVSATTNSDAATPAAPSGLSVN